MTCGLRESRYVRVTDDKIVREQVVPVTRVAQSESPGRNAGGDCFACATMAMFRALFPELTPSWDQVYAAWTTKSSSDTDVFSNTWHYARSAFMKLSHELGVDIDVTAHIDVRQPKDVEEYSGAFWHEPFRPKPEIVEGFLATGHVLYFEVAADPKLPVNSDGTICAPDHVLLVNGYRRRYRAGYMKYADHKGEEQEMWSGGWDDEFLVTCSARGQYWIDDALFARRHGAAGYLAVRRRAA